MSQESEPRFSHITVGRPNTDASTQHDAEEVITIGAVDAVSAPASAPAAAAPAAASAPTPAAEAVEAAEGDAVPRTRSDIPTALSGDGMLDDAGLDAPMPTAQKLVVAVCLVALAITVAFLVWFWMTQR